jgi:hypothetical protein
MFRQMKVDIAGIVENMSYFVCPHCNHEIDVFSRGGAERTARQFGVDFLGSIQLDPEIRRAGDEANRLCSKARILRMPSHCSTSPEKCRARGADPVQCREGVIQIQ